MIDLRLAVADIRSCCAVGPVGFTDPFRQVATENLVDMCYQRFGGLCALLLLGRRCSTLMQSGKPAWRSR